MGKVSSLTSSDLDNRLVDVSRGPISLLVFVLIFEMGRQHLSFVMFSWSSLPFYKWLEHVSFVLAVAVAVFWADAVLRTIIDWFLDKKILARSKTALANHMLLLMRRLVRILVYFVGITVILDHFNVKITGLLATAGVASLAVALAAQDTLGNMLAGLMIMLDRPFHEGDRIELADGLYGDVLEIGPRTSKILTREKTVIVVPNKDLASSRIINYCYPSTKYRLILTVGVAYGTDLDRVKDIIMKILKNHQEVLDDPAPEVLFKQFGASSLDMEILCWIPHPRRRRFVRDEINMTIKKRFEEAGIEIPFPQRDVHIYYSKKN